MLTQVEQPFAPLCLLVATLASALSACKVDIRDGVYACATTEDCPSGLRCDNASKHCTRQPEMDAPDASAPHAATEAVSEMPKDAGRTPDPEKPAADAAPSSSRTDAGAPPVGPHDAGTAQAGRTAIDAGTSSMQQAPVRAGTGGSERAEGGAGARAEQAGTAAQSGAAGSAADPISDCTQGTYCYGFETGALDPSGALWPSPSDGSGQPPPNGELTTTTYPAASQNHVLVSRPSAKDGWPKATVGFSGPATPFSKLVVSFDYVAGAKLVDPKPRVILFRFVGMPEKNGDSVNVGLLNKDAMLEVQTEGPDALTSIGPASAPGMLTHVVATFTRGQAACTVEVAYGALPLKAAAFPCEVLRWQIELGLDMLETPPEQYTQDYSAFFDNLQVSSTP